MGAVNFMKTFGLFIVIPGILLMAGGAFTSAGQPEKSEQTTMITARVGEEFTITLDSNPTTGYSWKLSDSFPKGIIKLLGSEYQPPVTRRKGAGGKEIWRFKTLAVGKTTITLEYLRPWEKDKPPAATKTFSITVK